MLRKSPLGGQITTTSVGEGLGPHIALWERHLKAANRSAKTIQEGEIAESPTGAANAVLLLCYHSFMAVRKKRSISMPPDLDAAIEAAATEAGMTYSAWLAATARKEFTIRAGLDAVTRFEREHGAFNADELAQAEEWARGALARSKRTGARQRRTA